MFIITKKHLDHPITCDYQFIGDDTEESPAYYIFVFCIKNFYLIQLYVAHILYGLTMIHNT